MDGPSFDCFDETFTFGVPGSLCNWESCWEFWDKLTNGECWATLVNRPTCKGKIFSKTDTHVKNTLFTVSDTSICTSLTCNNSLHCGTLRDLLPFVQIKTLEKHPWGSVTFSSTVNSKITIKKQERRHWRCSGVFIVTFEPTTLIKVTLLDWWFSSVLICTNGTKSRNASQFIMSVVFSNPNTIKIYPTCIRPRLTKFIGNL